MLLRLENISVGYFRDIMVLRDVSLEARPEHVTTIIGPNGAGKSTVLKAAYGFLSPTAGEVKIAGRAITGKKPHTMLQEGLAFVMQERAIFPFLTVEENLELGAWVFRHDKPRVRQSIDEIYHKYPALADRRSVHAGNLSGGEQRMLEMGKALMNYPKVILFDEPTAGLSPVASGIIFTEIAKLKAEKRTILMVEQNVKKAMTITDHVYALELGRVSFSGSVEEINLKDAITPWVNW
jgi:branched-chain amino acid transport system ATP-binding protein